MPYDGHFVTYSDDGRRRGDGIEWRLPCLGQFADPTGSTDNNVVLDPESRPHQYSNVMRTPHLGPGRRYTLLALTGHSHYVRFSDDGLVWTDWSSEPVIPRFADVGFYMYDERDRLPRHGQVLPGGAGPAAPHPELDGERRRARVDSPAARRSG